MANRKDYAGDSQGLDKIVVLYVCLSITALQINSSEPSF